jgi:hypothetical protein
MNAFSLLPLLLAPLFLNPQSPTPTPIETQTTESSTAVETRIDVISGFGVDQWTLNLPAGEYTHIVVDGDGDSDLDAYLLDESGNLVDSDEDFTDYCILGVVPAWTGTFTLRIVNRGPIANIYELTVE